ncbi:hypothetical protein [Salegentibacter maritimus]|uniref:hypothetical protein n=1 Tax=Salegentibacter maritimus TaxID=2794347 RepID=UPI00293D7F30|nr:hypothetical protein [Salegentibacter maritimus]
MGDNKPEVWLRGKVAGVPNLLQPVAHALLQSMEEIEKYTQGFPEELLWEMPSGRASVGFHLQHLTGILDRMLSYAKAEKLSEAQFAYLKNEGNSNEDISMKILVQNFRKR